MTDDNQFDNISITSEGIREIEKGQSVKQAPKQEVREIEFKRGYETANPPAMIIIGLALIGVSWVALDGVVEWLLFGGTLYLDVSFGLLLMLPLGLWCIFTALRVRYLLVVDLQSGGRQKFAFSKKVNVDEAREYSRMSAADFGYELKISE